MLRPRLALLAVIVLSPHAARAEDAVPRVAFEVEVRVRIAEAEMEGAALEGRYGSGHPRRIEIARRLTILRAAMAASTPPSPELRQRAIERLRALGVGVLAEQARLRHSYGDQHPEVLANARRLAVLERHLADLGSALQSGGAEPPPTFATLVVDETVAEASLSRLALRYGDRHPEVAAARVALGAAREALGRSGPATAVEVAAARRALLEAIAVVRAERDAQAARDPAGAGVDLADAVLDALAARGARLLDPAPPVVPVRPHPPRARH